MDITGHISQAYTDILTPAALAFIAKLQRTFNAQRKSLLSKRIERQQALDAGQFPTFLPETRHIRED
ncbi:MAG: malate synthase A, partial [Calditrichaeota bacterium]|nr:malate synthase A [Calditrichota bacterium]